MTITLVYNDEGDWAGVYVDGKLKYENHSISERELLDAIGVEYEAIGAVDLEPYGYHLPFELKDITGGANDLVDGADTWRV